jgi:glucokinase
MVYIGIDLGGTNIKGGICRGEDVLIKKEVKTGKGADEVIKRIAALINDMLAAAGIDIKDVAAIGAGIPGMIDSDGGMVLYSNNLVWKHVDFIKRLKEELGADIPIYITNDANAAALGEAQFGAAKEYSDSILITLGTGVGGGVIIQNKIFDGNKGAGAELGHMVIKVGGEKCTCGRKGCFESYSSASALIRETIKAMQKDKNSQLWEICCGKVENVSGKTAFAAYNTDKTAKKVVDNYIKNLSEGLANLANIFRPQAILLGGGISKEGESLIQKVRKRFDKSLFGTKLGPCVQLKLAALRNDAGFLGAIALAKQKCENV